MGLTLDYYWSLNPIQYVKHQKAFERRIEDEIKRQDVLNFSLGKYISFAFHEPNKYPKRPFSSANVDKQQTIEQLKEAAILITKTLGGSVNGR